jgi:hypothetical protein
VNAARVAPARPALAKLVAAAFLAAAIAALSATAALTSVHAGVVPACSVLVSSTNNPVPAESATIMVGEQGMITGSGFTPDTELAINVTLDGVDQGTFPQMTDGSGGFTLTGTLMQEQIGVLVLTATDGQVCSDFVTINVVTAPAPTPEDLPDAAMPPLGPAPDGPAVFGGLILYAAVAALAAVTLRSRHS